MLLVHVGRRSGQPRAMTAMVVRYDPASREVVILSAWGPESDWVRNLHARPALRVEIGPESFRPRHRFLTEDESVAVARQFVSRHPYRTRLICRILGWPDLRSEPALRAFVVTHPFVGLRPVQTP